MKNKNLLLGITAIIWGFNYIPQHLAMGSMGPYFFSSIRFVVAMLVMALILFIRRDKKTKPFNLKAGIICGCCLTLASISQQVGLIYTLPGKASFISCLYIIFVPLLSMLFYREKPTLKLWICAIIALAGLYLLTVKSSLGFEFADLIMCFSAVMYAVHIILIDKYAADVDVFKFNLIQFTVVAFASFVMATLSKDGFTISNVGSVIPMILFSGIVSTGIAYVTQTYGQIDNDPTVASLIMSLESPIAVLFGVLIIHETITQNEIVGMILIAIAIILIQLKPRGIDND